MVASQLLSRVDHRFWKPKSDMFKVPRNNVELRVIFSIKGPCLKLNTRIIFTKDCIPKIIIDNKFIFSHFVKDDTSHEH